MISMSASVGDTVRVYDDSFEWFSEGKIFHIDDTAIRVDFLDWQQQYAFSDIEQRLSFYSLVYVAKDGTGITLKDFR